MINTHRKTAGIAITCAALVIILAFTLGTGDGAGRAPSPFCLLCSPHGAAEAILNVLLFVPLGAGLALLLERPRQAIWIGLAISLLIELVQFVIPGRAPAVSDLATNTLGLMLGIGLVRSAHAWLQPSELAANALQSIWLLFIISTLLAVSALLAPDLSRSTWWGQWTARLGSFAHYDGKLLSAVLGSTPLPSYQLPDTDLLRTRLLSGDTVRLRFIAGTPPQRLAPVFSIADDAARDVLLIGARGSDVVVRYRTRARSLRFDVSEMVFKNALAGVARGDTVSLDFHWRHPRMDISVNGRAFTDAPSFADGASLLLESQPFLSGRHPAVRALWLGALFAPLGFFARRNRGSALVIGTGLAFLVLAPRGGLPIGPTAALDIGFAVLGLVIGIFAYRASRGICTADATLAGRSVA